MIWIIAWKNIWRNRMRSLVVVAAIALGLTGGIFSSAVLKGSGDQRVREAVSRELSHIQIHHPDYIRDNEVKYQIDGNLPKLAETLDTLQAVAAWSSRIKFTAMAGSANAGTGVMVYGIDPSRESRVTDIHSLICDSCGTWFNDPRGGSIVVGEALAEKLKVRLHSRIVLTFQDMEGNLTGAAFRICGLYRTSNSVFDEMNVYVERNDIIPLLAAKQETCHEIAVRLKDGRMTEKTVQALQRFFPALLVRDWKKIDPLVALLDNFMDLWLYLFMGIIMLALGFGIINTMLMAILERTRELGMLAAVGMNKQRIFLMVMLESVLLSLTGGIAGMILGILLTLYTRHTGIDLGSFTEGFEQLGYNPMLYPSLHLMFFINLTGMVILTGILASVYPARQALRMRPAEAIRRD